LVVGAVEEGIANGWISGNVDTDVLNEFLSGRGRRFYQLKDSAVESGEKKKIVLEKKGERIPEFLRNQDGSVEIAPFRRGEEVWSLTWK
jgi:dihydroorotase